jgi:hypothetical protein
MTADSPDPLLRIIAEAPEDDEPLTAADRAAIAASGEDVAAGRLIPLSDLERQLDR